MVSNNGQIKHRTRVTDHGEVFTHEREVNSMLDLVKQETERLDSRFLEPACGNGNFLAEVLNRKLRILKNRYSKSQYDYERYSVVVISSIYGIDILKDNVEECKDEFEQRDDFEAWRNKIGSLILLPEGFNQSYGTLPYEKKLPHYFGQNLLARSLSPQCYERNPNFLKYKDESDLPFKPHEQFKKKDVEERQLLYQKILEEIYDLKRFDEVIK